MQKWTNNDEKYLKDNYNTLDYKTLAKSLNRSEGAIRAKCFDLGLVKNDRWTIEEEQYVSMHYTTALSINDIASVLHRTPTAVQIKARKMGLKRSEYTCNHRFFQNIDTEEKAYWLGFIYADGYISINNQTNSAVVGIELRESDINHIKKFNKSINGNYKVSIRSRQCNLSQHSEKFDIACIRIYSLPMFNDLKNHGIVENKTYRTEYPIIDKNFMIPFIRGYFDGNGWIMQKQSSYTVCAICGKNEAFFNYIRSYLYDNYSLCSYISYQKNHFSGMYVLNIHKNEQSVKFLNLIYGSSNIHLQRKYLQYQQSTTSSVGLSA